jgi:hypothetical protein
VSKRKITDSGLLGAEIHRITRKDGEIVSAPYLYIQLMEGARDFPENALAQLVMLAGQIFRVLERASAGDESAMTHLAAIHKIAFADTLELSKSNLEEIAGWRGVSRTRSYAWLWFDLITKVAAVIEPADPSKTLASDRVKLREGLPEDHPLVRTVRTVFKKGKLNTTQSLARSIYELLINESNGTPPDHKSVGTALKEFLRYSQAREENPTKYIETLRMDGLDYYSIMNRTGLDRTVSKGEAKGRKLTLVKKSD